MEGLHGAGLQFRFTGDGTEIIGHMGFRHVLALGFL